MAETTEMTRADIEDRMHRLMADLGNVHPAHMTPETIARDEAISAELDELSDALDRMAYGD